MPKAMKASEGTTNPIIHRYRLWSCHRSVVPAGTVALAMSLSSRLTSVVQM